VSFLNTFFEDRPEDVFGKTCLFEMFLDTFLFPALIVFLFCCFLEVLFLRGFFQAFVRGFFQAVFLQGIFFQEYLWEIFQEIILFSVVKG
jgi:hypothetical protein